MILELARKTSSIRLNISYGPKTSFQNHYEVFEKCEGVIYNFFDTVMI